MKKAIYITIIIFLLFSLNSYGQCLCGNIQLKIPIDDLSYKNDNSNYELIVIEKPERFSYDSKILNKSYFSNDTLNLNFSTGFGINKLKIELKNRVNATSMQITLLNMTYDNDYLIDLSKFISGNYTFDWKKIDACQSQNKTSQIVECQEMIFLQLDLQTKNLNFNNNKIKVPDLNYFLDKNDHSAQIKNDEEKAEIKERIESLLLSKVDSIYFLEKNKYFFTQRNVSGNGNHYYDEIILRIISFSKNKITLYPIDIEIKENNGYLDKNGSLIISQHQLYDFKESMFVRYNYYSKILEYQFNTIDLQSNSNLSSLKNIQYLFVNGKFEMLAERLKKIQLD